MSERLSRKNRLKRDADFKRLLKSRFRLRRGGLTVIVARNGLPFARLGVRASKRIGNAVRRNYMKRAVKEVFRRRLMTKMAGYDTVVLIVEYLRFSHLEERMLPMFEELLRKAKVSG